MNIRGLAEIVLYVHDLEASARFYRDLLGLKVISPPAAKALFLQAGPNILTCPQQIVLTPLPPATPAFPTDRTHRPLHHIGFEIDPQDLPTTLARLKAQAIPYREGEHPFLPLRGIYLDDPDGNEVELLLKR